MRAWALVPHCLEGKVNMFCAGFMALFSLENQCAQHSQTVVFQPCIIKSYLLKYTNKYNVLVHRAYCMCRLNFFSERAISKMQSGIFFHQWYCSCFILFEMETFWKRHISHIHKNWFEQSYRLSIICLMNVLYLLYIYMFKEA